MTGQTKARTTLGVLFVQERGASFSPFLNERSERWTTTMRPFPITLTCSPEPRTNCYLPQISSSRLLLCCDFKAEFYEGVCAVGREQKRNSSDLKGFLQCSTSLILPTHITSPRCIHEAQPCPKLDILA
jgi:hypothetical protein